MATATPADTDRRWLKIEDLLLQMRCLWFDAAAKPFYSGRILTEPGAELVGMISGTNDDAQALVDEAYRREAYVIFTPFTRPADLPLRLINKGYHLLSRQGTYIYEPTAAAPPPRRFQSPPQGPGWKRWWRNIAQGLRRPVPIRVAAIGPDRLSVWSRVCDQSFGRRGQKAADTLAEKQRMYRVFGPSANWYLAYAGERPVGCTILYRGADAAQIMAVGTVPRFRTRGVATAMVKRAIQDWQAAGGGILFLDTQPGGRAERLYLQIGFRLAYTRSIYGCRLQNSRWDSF